MHSPQALATLAVAAALAARGARAEDGGGGSSTTIYVIVGVVVLLFIGAAVFVWLRSRKKGKDLENPPPPPPSLSSAMPQPPQPQMNNRRGPARDNNAYEQYRSPGGAREPVMRGAYASASSQSDHDDRYGRAPPSHPHQQPQHRQPPPAPRQARPTPAPRPRPTPQGAPSSSSSQPLSQPKSEVAARVLAEFQADPALCRRKIPYAALYFTRVLSKGAFGEVWLAQLENRQVAVKRILNEKKNDEKEIECFAAEIKLMASFYHPKIVEFVGVSWSTLQDLCAVTEYMAKGDLYGFLKRKNGQLNWRDHKIYLAEDVADALGYLHSLTPKVIHRDLKSKNILLDDTFRAKLSDFGISRERSLEETMTAGVGTIYWTAPEVLMGKKYTEKADIYSFGIVMSELDTHEVPYSDMRDEAGKKLQGMKIVQQVIKKKLRPTFSAQCPSKVRELALRCLDAEPDVRPDALELLSLIQRIQQKL